jgi:hypothetical protein
VTILFLMMSSRRTLSSASTMKTMARRSCVTSLIDPRNAIDPSAVLASCGSWAGVSDGEVGGWMNGWTQVGIQAKIDTIKEDIQKWQIAAAAGREKLTALVPALPELRFLAQVRH